MTKYFGASTSHHPRQNRRLYDMYTEAVKRYRAGGGDSRVLQSRWESAGDLCYPFALVIPLEFWGLLTCRRGCWLSDTPKFRQWNTLSILDHEVVLEMGESPLTEWLVE
jgi:hypothetical protein